MSEKIIVESLSMDLLRVALGLHRGSLTMAERFRQEALKRERELESIPRDPKLDKLISGSKKLLQKTKREDAEDILMYSVLFRNYAQKYFKNP